MSNPYPLPRSIRETEWEKGDGRITYGPFSFKIFDNEDVQVRTREIGSDGFEVANVAVSKVNGAPFDNFLVTFGGAIGPDTEYQVRGLRVHKRTSDLFRGGTIKSDEVEKVASEEAVVLQEVRRDVNEGVALTLVERAARIAADNLLHGRVDNEIIDRVNADRALASLIGQAGPIEVGFYDSRLAAASANIKPNHDVLLVGGGDAPGDGDAAWYMRVASDGDFKSLDGAWWKEFYWNGEKTTVKNWGVPAIPRSVGDKLRDYAFLEDYGGGSAASGAENVTAFNNAQSSLKAQSGKGAHILMRAGVYEQASAFTLLSGVTLEGAGADSTILRPTFSVGEAINIGNDIAVVQHANAKGFSIEPANQMTAGSLVRFRNHFFCCIENIRMPVNIKWGVAIDKGAVSYIAKLKDVFANAGEFGLVVGNQGTGDVQNIDVVGCQFGQQTGAGIALFNVGGIFIDTTECLMCNVGLFTYPDVNSRILGMRVGAKVYFDTCTAAAAQVYSNGGKVTESQFNGTWFSSTSSVGGAGVDVHSSAGADLIRNVNFIGTTFTNNRGAGIRLNACQDIHLTGVDAVANGMEYYHDGATRAPGIQVLGGASGINIVGGRSGKSGNFDFNYQDYGVTISAGASNVSMVGIDCRGNAIGGVADGSGVAKISEVPGARASTHGAFLFPSGVSAHTVNHDLAFTPTYADINVTVAGILEGSGIKGIYVTGTTATTITFSANTNLTSPINVVWSARVKG